MKKINALLLILIILLIAVPQVFAKASRFRSFTQLQASNGAAWNDGDSVIIITLQDDATYPSENHSCTLDADSGAVESLPTIVSFTSNANDKRFLCERVDGMASGTTAGGDLTGTYPNPTIAPDSVALTTDTTGNYAAGDAEAGSALTGDSATAFFSSGEVEDARIVDALTVAGGSVNDSPTGDITPSTGSFTTITASGETELNDTVEIIKQATSTATSKSLNAYNFDSSSGGASMPQVSFFQTWGVPGAVVPVESGHIAGGTIGVNRSTAATPIYRISSTNAWLISPQWRRATYDTVPELEYILGQNIEGTYGHVLRLASGNLSLSGVDTDTFDRYPQTGMKVSIADGDSEIYDASTLGLELLTDISFDAVGDWIEAGTGFTVAGDGDVNYSHVDIAPSRLSLASTAMTTMPSKYGVRYSIQVVLDNFANCGTDNVNLTRLYLDTTTATCNSCVGGDTLLGNTLGRPITNQFQSGWYANEEGGAVFADGTYNFIIQGAEDISEFEIVAISATSCDFDITSVSMKKVDGGSHRVAGTLTGNIIVAGYEYFVIPDSGDGNPATKTIFDDELGSSLVILYCLDVDGCTLTVAETAAYVETGKIVKFVNESLGVITVTDVDGVCDLAGDTDAILTRPDTLSLTYTDTRWAQDNSDN